MTESAGSAPLSTFRREGFALRLASSGDGPSSAYSAAGFSYTDRTSLSRNANSQAAKTDVQTRVKWLQAHPAIASQLLSEWVAAKSVAEAEKRSLELRKAAKARATATAKKAALTAPESPVTADDVEPILSLLEYCRDEARAIYVRVSEQRSDPYLIKSSLSSHRDFTVQLEAVRDQAKTADATPTVSDHAPGIVAQIMANIRAALNVDYMPPLATDDEPIFQSIESKESASDVANLKFNVAATVKEYDDLCTRPVVNQRDRLALLTVLQGSLVKLAKMIASQSKVQAVEARPIVIGEATDIDLVGRYFEESGLTKFLEAYRQEQREAMQNATPPH